MNKFHREDHQPRGLRVEVHNNDLAKALRKLKKKIADDGIMQDIKNKEYFESKSVRRRKAKEAAIRRYKKTQKMQDL
jgi:ribosomal protein S21